MTPETERVIADMARIVADPSADLDERLAALETIREALDPQPLIDHEDAKAILLHPTPSDEARAERLLATLTQMVEHDPDKACVTWDSRAAKEIARALADKGAEVMQQCGGLACAIAGDRVKGAVREAVQPFIDADLATPDGKPRTILGTPEFDNQGRVVGLKGEFWTIHGGKVVKCYTGEECYAYLTPSLNRVVLALVPDENAEDADDCHTLYESEAAALAAQRTAQEGE